MKTLQEQLNQSIYQNKELTSKRINEAEDLSPKIKNEIRKKYDEIDKIVKKMNIGRFTYEGCGYRGCRFKINNRMTWGFELDFFNKGIKFDSVASYGSFQFDDEIFDLYMSIGAILSQEKELKEIENLMKEAQVIYRNAEKEIEK